MSYRRKHVKNKIHKIKPKKSIFKRPVFWYSILSLLIVSVSVYFVLFYSGLYVKDIIISGNKKVFSQDLKDIVLKEVNKKLFGILNWNVYTESIFLVNAKNINKEILSKFPMVESIKISKNFPSTIILGVTERKPIGVYCPSVGSGQSNCFLIDQNGVIFEPSVGFVSDSISMVIKQALQNQQAVTGEDIVNKNIMDAIIKIEKNMKDNFQIDLTEALLSNPLRLDITTIEAWKIYFDISSDSDIDSQLTKLNLLLQQQISPEERDQLEYIDLRFRDRAYYK